MQVHVFRPMIDRRALVCQVKQNQLLTSRCRTRARGLNTLGALAGRQIAEPPSSGELNRRPSHWRADLAFRVSLCGKGNALINIYAITSTGFDEGHAGCQISDSQLLLPVFEIEVREFILLPYTSTGRAH
jgi:hypothetical protein